MTTTMTTPATRRKRNAGKRNAGKRGRPVSRDRLELYQESVQNAGFEVDFFRRAYRKIRDREPVRFREDFCGTALLACKWVQRVKNGWAQGVDNHGPTLDWGRERNLAALGKRAHRVELREADVRDRSDFVPDVVAAVNFSYFIFKSRSELKAYFQTVHDSLAEDGVFVVDLYGGPEAQIRQEESTKHKGFTYIWDQDRYNPVTGEALCHIHFKFPDGTRMQRAFTYDWRLWTLPELRDLLDEVGFRTIDPYWEGTDTSTGEGNGVYRISHKGDSSQSWVAYIAAGK